MNFVKKKGKNLFLVLKLSVLCILHAWVDLIYDFCHVAATSVALSHYWKIEFPWEGYHTNREIENTDRIMEKQFPWLSTDRGNYRLIRQGNTNLSVIFFLSVTKISLSMIGRQGLFRSPGLTLFPCRSGCMGKLVCTDRNNVFPVNSLPPRKLPFPYRFFCRQFYFAKPTG